jgi:hypothetical protein
MAAAAGDLGLPGAERDSELLRRRGWRGGLILPHRAFARLPLRRTDIASSLTLAVVLTAGWIVLLPAVGRIWGGIFAFWAQIMQFHAQVVMVPQQWFRPVHFALPFVSVSAGSPDPWTWWITGAVTLGVVGLTFFLSREQLPWIYLLRFLAIIQTTSLLYFAFAAARFPHDLADYIVGMMVFGTILIGLVPFILGFTYYVFDFSVWQKLALSLMIMAHLAIFIPLQYMLHTWILHNSILFMPVLYFAFGPFLDVLVFIAFYSWGMSWKSPQSRISP